MSNGRYEMGIDLNVLNHLGLNLYSNTPAVLSEVIANAWDADATRVDVEFDVRHQLIVIRDNGRGMNLDDINNKYLLIGYQKRREQTETRLGRKPMGRKGIGKLSLFSIARRVSIFTLKQQHERESFVMDAGKIRELIANGNSSQLQKYRPEPVVFDEDIERSGTVIRIQELKKVRLTKNSVLGLKKRIARRFGIVGDKHDFHIFIDGNQVTIADRDYFHKARFLFRYGGQQFEENCENLDLHKDGRKLFFTRDSRFDRRGNATLRGQYAVNGWIAIARNSNDLDGQGDDENLNKIPILVRGKVAQEDILHDFRLGGMITKYMYGEVYADFLDQDDRDDIATSGRQRIMENDERYQAIKGFLRSELLFIWKKTNALKEKGGLRKALSSNPHVREWFCSIKSSAVKKVARKIFGAIDQAGVDEGMKGEFYANAVLAIEALRMREMLSALPEINEANVESFLELLADIDVLEKAKYYEIVEGRLKVIRRLKKYVDSNAFEKVIQSYIFEHLWLLDPSWERAVSNPSMEQVIQRTLDDIVDKGRIDIRYQQVLGEHVIVELKRPSVRMRKTQLEDQITRYMDAVKQELKLHGRSSKPVQGICLVGKLPLEWRDEEKKRIHEIGLRMQSIRIITYKELVDNAESAYLKFISESQEVGHLRKRIEDIRSYHEA